MNPFSLHRSLFLMILIMMMMYSFLYIYIYPYHFSIQLISLHYALIPLYNSVVIVIYFDTNRIVCIVMGYCESGSIGSMICECNQSSLSTSTIIIMFIIITISTIEYHHHHQHSIISTQLTYLILCITSSVTKHT